MDIPQKWEGGGTWEVIVQPESIVRTYNCVCQPLCYKRPYLTIDLKI